MKLTKEEIFYKISKNDLEYLINNIQKYVINRSDKLFNNTQYKDHPYTTYLEYTNWYLKDILSTVLIKIIKDICEPPSFIEFIMNCKNITSTKFF